MELIDRDRAGAGAPPNASETKSWRFPLNAKPNGVLPAETFTVAVPSVPSLFTGNTSIRSVARSVTTSRFPSGLNATCAGAVLAALNG